MHIKEKVESCFYVQKQVKVLEEEKESIVIEEEDKLKDYYNLLEQHRLMNREIRDIVLSPRYCLPFLQPGRLVSLQCSSSDEDIAPLLMEEQVTWGLVINFESIKNVSGGKDIKVLWFIYYFMLTC